MTESAPIGELAEGFSEPGSSAPPWAEVDAVLAAAEMFWLSTVRGDGRPHVTPIPAIWHDGALHVCTGSHEQKARNLGREPRCVLSAGANRFREGLDVVVEGTAVAVTDEARLRELAALWKERLDWDFAVEDGAFRDGADRRGLVFAVAPEKVLAFGKAPYTQTRYRF